MPRLCSIQEPSGGGSYAFGMPLIRTFALVPTLITVLVVSSCSTPSGPVAEPPSPPQPSQDASPSAAKPSMFSDACEQWDPQSVEWRKLANTTQTETADDAGVTVSISRASLPPSGASRYNTGVEICPDFLWVLNHAGDSRFVSLSDQTWSPGPTLDPSGRTDSVGAPGVESGGEVWGFRGSVATGEWLYLSDAVVDTTATCVRVDVHRVAIADLLSGDNSTAVIYESTPCVDYSSSERARTPIKIHMGGALAYSATEDELYVSLGDFHLGASRISQAVSAGLDATERDYALLLDDRAALSAVVAIRSPSTAPEARVFAKGLRNSLGMTVDNDGTLWLTDHGPGGGDELNAITEGGNYGWPLTSEGQPYDRGSWPRDPNQLLAPWLDIYQADVPGAIRPQISWSPAIAPSSIVQYSPRSVTIPEWDGDLIFGTLRGQALMRITPGGDGSPRQSRLPIGERIRDVILTSNGSLALLTDSSVLVTVGR